MGRDGLSPGDHRRHAALRQARRPVRPQGRAAGRARDLPRRLRAVRSGAGDDRAHRVPRHPGARRRRADGQRAGRDRRRRVAAPAREVRGPLRRGLRRVVGGRAPHRRVLHQPPVVALDLLHQPPARPPRARGPGRHAPERHRARAAQGRLPRRRAARGRTRRDRPADDARRHVLRLGLGADRRARRDRDRRDRGVRVRRVPRGRADPPAAPVPQQRLPDDERDRVRHRLRALRSTDLPAALPAGRARRLPHRIGPAARAGHGRRPDRLDRVGPDHHGHRALQGVPDRRHRARRDRDVPPVAAGRGDARWPTARSRCSSWASGWAS